MSLLQTVAMSKNPVEAALSEALNIHAIQDIYAHVIKDDQQKIVNILCDLKAGRDKVRDATQENARLVAAITQEMLVVTTQRNMALRQVFFTRLGLPMTPENLCTHDTELRRFMLGWLALNREV